MEQTATLHTRIIHKHDLEVNWLKAVNFIPKQGELIVYDIEVDKDGKTLELPSGRTAPYIYERFKLGDGITNISDLPFCGEGSIEDVIALPETGDLNTTYRLLEGTFLLKKRLRHDCVCNIVEWDNIPTEPGTSVLQGDLSNDYIITGYYNVKNNTVYGYFDSSTANMIISYIDNLDLDFITKELLKAAIRAMSTGWKTLDDILSSIGSASDLKWGGIIGNIEDATDVNSAYLYLSNNIYNYMNGNWLSHKAGIGTYGEGPASEIFNDFSNIASGNTSHAEGKQTKATGDYSHAEGNSTESSGQHSHAEGLYSLTKGSASHAEGRGTRAIGDYSHAEGHDTEAYHAAHAEGNNTHAHGYYSHAEGRNANAKNDYAHAEGYNTEASGDAAHVEGSNNTASETAAHAEGFKTTASAVGAHSEGRETTASGVNSHAEGNGTVASNSSAHAEGNNTQANGVYSHAEGNASIAGGQAAHAEGVSTQANGVGSHTEGNGTTSSGNYAHAEGQGPVASGQASHAEGINATTASGKASHAEGTNTKAQGDYSHSEGWAAVASGVAAHAEGYNTKAVSDYSHAGGQGTITSRVAQTAIGTFNATNDNALFLVGNGDANTTASRKNAFSVLADGRAQVGKDPQEAMDVVTKQYLEANTSKVSTPTQTISYFTETDFEHYYLKIVTPCPALLDITVSSSEGAFPPEIYYAKIECTGGFDNISSHHILAASENLNVPVYSRVDSNVYGENDHETPCEIYFPVRSTQSGEYIEARVTNLLDDKIDDINISLVKTSDVDLSNCSAIEQIYAKKSDIQGAGSQIQFITWEDND